jgi:hypothetical protein
MLMEYMKQFRRNADTRRGLDPRRVQFGSKAPSPRTIQVADITGPLGMLAGCKVLVLLDEENLSISSERLGAAVSYRRLANVLKGASRECRLHAFFSREPSDENKVKQLSDDGWIAHSRDIETVRTHRGLMRRSNSDNLIIFNAGLLVSRSDADVVILASGDGDLVSDLSSCLRSLPKRRRLVTLSVAGSTSWRLDATKNTDIDTNIELGQDCLG